MRKAILLFGVIFGLAILVSNCARKSEQVLNQEIQKALEDKKPQVAVRTYSQLIRAYPKSPNVPKAYFGLGAVYFGNLNEQKKAEETWGKLTERFPQFDLEKELFTYAQKCQDERNPGLAIKVYDEILSFLPKSQNKDKALFLKGFVYSEQIKDYPKAKEIFEKFISEYPQSDLKDDAEFMLKNSGKEPDFEKSK